MAVNSLAPDPALRAATRLLLSSLSTEIYHFLFLLCEYLTLGKCAKKGTASRLLQAPGGGSRLNLPPAVTILPELSATGTSLRVV